MANDREFIIQPLINEGKVVTLADIDPNTTYAQIGVWQANQSKSASAENNYPSYVIPLSELIGSGGTPITSNVIPRGTGLSITDGTWAFSGNDIIPITSCSNIGSPTNRVQTVYMCSEIDYLTDLIWKSTTEKMRLTSGGNLGIGVTPVNDLHIEKSAPGLGVSVSAKVKNTAPSGFSLISVESDNNINGANIVVFNSAGGVGTFYDNDNAGLSVNAPLGLLVNENAAGGWVMTAGGYGATQERLRVTTTQTSFIRNKVAITDGTIPFVSTASLHVRGLDATGGNYAIKIENIAANNLYSASNNGINSWNTYFDGIGTGIANFMYTTSAGGILQNFESVNGFSMIFTEATVNKGAFQNAGGFCQISSQFRFTLKDNGNISKLWMDGTTGYTGIGAAYFTANAQMHIQGESATAANYAQIVENNLGTVLLSLRNDGRASMPSIQTGNAGLSTGDLYVDTAANILANGDLVLGRKV